MKISLRTKVTVAVLLMAFVLVGVAGKVSYNVYSNTMNTHYEALTTNVARSAASMVDEAAVTRLTRQTVEIYRSLCPDADTPPDFDSFTEADWADYYAAYATVTGSEDYQKLFDTLAALKEDNGVLSMYLAYLDPQTGEGIYILDADNTENGCLTGACDRLEAANVELLLQGVYDIPPYITNYPEYGWLSSAGAAITGADGVIANVFVDISMNDVMADRRAFIYRLGMILGLLTALLILVLTYAMTRAVVQPINRLSRATATFVTDKQGGTGASAISQLQIHTGDEIEALCHSVQKMEQEINSYITNLAAVTAEKERIGAELDVAARIQADMLPCTFPAFEGRTEFDIYATMTPAKEVGGDFYDFFLIDDDHLAMVMADVSGKGVPAALFMMISKTLLKSAAQAELSPQKVLEKVNRQLCENNDADMFVTVWLGILQISTGVMECANAGHEYPVLRQGGGAFKLLRDRHGLMLAGMEHSHYQQYSVQLAPGDTLFVYTDGVPEATNEHNELYGLKRMLAALNRNPELGCQDLLPAVHADVNHFVGDAPQFDDITMLCLKLNGPIAPAKD